MPGLFYPATAEAVRAGPEGLDTCFHLGPALTSLRKVGEGLEAYLSDDEVIPCNLVAFAAGLHPRTELAFAAGLAVNCGVVVDRSLHTSHVNIYALGDCAEADGFSLLYVMPLTTRARTLTQTLVGNPSQVAYGPMPVAVKTPACPPAVSPSPCGVDGQWLVEGSGTDLKVLCRGIIGRMIGHVLTGAAVDEKLVLNKELPGLMA